MFELHPTVLGLKQPHYSILKHGRWYLLQFMRNMWLCYFNLNLVIIQTIFIPEKMDFIFTKCLHRLAWTALLRFVNTAMWIKQFANRKRRRATTLMHKWCTAELKPSWKWTRRPAVHHFYIFAQREKKFINEIQAKLQTHSSQRQVLNLHVPLWWNPQKHLHVWNVCCQFHSPMSGAVTVKSFPEETTFIPPFVIQEDFAAAAAKKKKKGTEWSPQKTGLSDCQRSLPRKRLSKKYKQCRPLNTSLRTTGQYWQTQEAARDSL